MQDNQDKDTSKEEVKTTREYKNRRSGGGGGSMFVLCVCCTVKTKDQDRETKYGKSTKR
jgi:heme A synthase